MADFLNVSESWVYKASASGELPVLRMGAMLRFLPSHIHVYALGPMPHETVADALERTSRGR